MRNRNISDFCHQTTSRETFPAHKKVRSKGATTLLDDDINDMSDHSLDDEIELSVTCDKALNDDEMVTAQENELVSNVNSSVPNNDLINSSLHPEDVELLSSDEPINDISHLVRKKVTDDVKMDLRNVWKPDEGFVFPKNKIKSFQLHWLIQFNWLVYSKILDGGFCLYCVLFGSQTSERNSTKLKKLFTEPFTNWSHALEQFRLHESKFPIHKLSVERQLAF